MPTSGPSSPTWVSALTSTSSGTISPDASATTRPDSRRIGANGRFIRIISSWSKCQDQRRAAEFGQVVCEVQADDYIVWEAEEVDADDLPDF